jgi:hypothetical protein
MQGQSSVRHARRLSRAIGLLATLGLVAALGAPAQATHAIDLGAYVQQEGSETQVQAYQRFEAAGGDIDITRHYLTDWADNFTWTFIRWSASNGNTPYISLHATTVTWADVAAGTQDAFLTNMATEMQGLGVPLWFVFHHEPENDDGGVGMLASDFKAATAHVYDVMDPICTNCTFGIVLLRGTYTGGNGGTAAWVPDTTKFDAIGSDLYSNSNTGLIQLSVLANPSLTYARSIGKPYIIGESGCSQAAAKKKTWLQNARTFLKANADIAMFDYSETNAQVGGDFRVEYQSGPLSAWQAMVLDPYFQ